MWHRVSHYFGWNRGQIVSFWMNGKLWVGYQCHTCEEINGAFSIGEKVQ